jgi:hypothetical protein
LAFAKTRFRIIRPAFTIVHLRTMGSFTHRLADALRHPPEPARLGRYCSPSTSAGPCDAILDTSGAEDRLRRRLLLLPTLRFLRFRFRFSLLRHCCPPSLSGWRHRCSAVANRRALPPDYYSRKKITVTPLNFVCKCPPAPLHRIHSGSEHKIRDEKNFGGATAREKLRALQKCRWDADFCHVSSLVAAPTLRTARATRAYFRAHEAADAAEFTAGKFFRAGGLYRRVYGRAGRKTRESVRTDSPARLGSAPAYDVVRGRYGRGSRAHSCR